MRICGICSNPGHLTDECPSLQERVMPDVNAVGGFSGQPQRKYDPHSNFYNPGWRNHPNFSYKNQGEQPKLQSQLFNRSLLAPTQALSQTPNSGMSLEDIVKSLVVTTQQFQQETKAGLQENKARLQKTEAGLQETRTELQETRTCLHHLGNQLSQLATSVSQRAAQTSEKLPSQTEANPRENVIAMTLQSGKELQPVEPTLTKAKGGEKRLNDTDSHTDKLDSNLVPPLSSNTCALSFPYRMSKSKEDEHEREILDTFKKVKINIPLLDAIKQILKYANFFKELCSNKMKLKYKERIIFGKNVSAVINRKLPEKCKDPGMFTLSCIIGNKRIERAMLDLGASINVMPYSVYQALNLSTLQDTNVIIQLVDSSNVHPMGLVEDVLVKVNDLLFLWTFTF
ncbi:UNVERIFIED_CONTAM: hypothetical protein Slati_2488600 [Sesamum latifolium]|uniref:CCHC-type domain-containing protein n=1 Tax=Sesamum latifolium TaxID=2727402 RepID=A0AAW2WHD2_9LAMI